MNDFRVAPDGGDCQEIGYPKGTIFPPAANPDVLLGLLMWITRTPVSEPLLPGTPEWQAYVQRHPGAARQAGVDVPDRSATREAEAG